MNMLNSSFTLPCGVKIPNRIIKSAMSENMANNGGQPSKEIIKLYETWGQGGAGILISGNVMVDHKALGEPHNVIIEDETYLSELRNWADKCQSNGSHLWMQINHPGRQAPRINKEIVSPSDVQLNLGKIFAKPRPLKNDEIWDIIDRFGNTALIAKKAGWKGVQIHGAHGYLVSQFLSTRTNLRTDDWGGTLEKRAKFPIEIYRNIRKKVGPKFPVGIKINSADFQKGAFTEAESLQVIDMLSQEGMDLIEVSGGTYEKSAMMGTVHKNSTLQREAYFSEFIVKARARTKAPLLLTGGFRSKEIMELALQNDELDFVGIARPFAINPNVARDLLEGDIEKCTGENIKTGFKKIDRLGVLDITWYTVQLERMGKGLLPNPKLNPWKVVGKLVIEQTKAMMKKS